MLKRNMVLGVLVAAMAAALPLTSFAADPAAPEDVSGPPDATIDFTAKQVRLLLGGAEGAGTLHFQGKNYPFTMKALGVGGVGVAKSAGVGNVYHLTKVEDFPGTYGMVGAGATVVKGGAGSILKNNNGVVVQTKSKTKGASLNLGAGGVTVKMAEKPV